MRTHNVMNSNIFTQPPQDHWLYSHALRYNAGRAALAMTPANVALPSGDRADQLAHHIPPALPHVKYSGPGNPAPANSARRAKGVRGDLVQRGGAP